MLFQVIITGLAAALANGLGIWLMQRRTEWTKRHSKQLIAIAAGLVIGIAFFHFAPELAHHNADAFPWVVASFMGLYIVEHHFAPHFHHHHAPESEHCHHNELGMMTTIGFGVHSIFDGLAIGAGFAFDLRLGLVAALAVLAHEIPEGITTFSTLLHSGYSKQRATLYSSLVACITPLVAIVSFLFMYGIQEHNLGVAMALATGSLLYIGATDLLPEAAHSENWGQTALILLGLGFAYALSLLGHH